MVKSILFWAIYFIYTLLGPIEALDGGNYCLSELCPRFKRHIACRHKGQMAKLCPNDTQLIDMSDYRNLIVNEHNELRNLLASGQMKQLPNPDRLAIMRWHEELEKLATLNVKQCSLNYDQCHNTLEFRNSGQNLIMLNISTLDESPSSGPTNETLIKYSIHSWWNQWKNVTWQYIEKFPKDKQLTNFIRNFAVMARDNGTYLGCAATRWLKQNVHHFLFACNYASNFIIDKPIYRLKTINCQSGYDKKYPGLCMAGEQYDKSLGH